jgi:hypothetical protein
MGVRPAVELDAIERDSTPPLITSVTVDDSVTLHVAFDKPIDPALPIQPALVQLAGADSTHPVVVGVQWAAGFDAAKRAADSTRRVDSLARADSLSRARDTSRARAAPPPVVAPVRPPVGVPGARPAPPAAKPKAPPPDRAIVVTLSPSTPLTPGKSYRITVRAFRNLVGHAADQTRPFQVPVPRPKPPPKDSTRARPDSTRPPMKPPARSS